MGAAVAVVVTVVSAAYQYNKQKKLRKQMQAQQAAAEEAAKGTEISVRGEIAPLVTVYGAARVAGVRTGIHVASSFWYRDHNDALIDSTRAPEVGTVFYPGWSYDERDQAFYYRRHHSRNSSGGFMVESLVRWFGNTVFYENRPNYAADVYDNVSPRLFGSERQARIGNHLYDINSDGSHAAEDNNSSSRAKWWGIARWDRRGLASVHGGLWGDQQGNKNEFLFTQTAICKGPITHIGSITVNERDQSAKDIHTWMRIHAYANGGFSSDLATANGFANTNRFSGAAFSTCAYKINRDDQNFSGEPEVAYYVAGTPVRGVVWVNNVPQFAESRHFTRNPALIFADYLTNKDVGLGLPDSMVDIWSIARAQGICDQIVLSNLIAPNRALPGNGSWRTASGGVLWNDLVLHGGPYNTRTVNHEADKPLKINSENWTPDPNDCPCWVVPNDQTWRFQGTWCRFYIRGKGTRGRTVKAYVRQDGYMSGAYNGNVSSQLFEQEISYRVWVPNGGRLEFLVQLEPNSDLTIYEIGVDNGVRNLSQFECNIALDSSNPIRENAAAILETMAHAEVAWSEGRYKLQLPDLLAPTYAERRAKLNASVHERAVFSSHEVIRDKVEIAWPDAEDRYNQYTIRFDNELENFKEDSVTWPDTLDTATGSTLNVYETYLAEDGGRPLKGESFIGGVTTPWHAKARAEEIVRQSRRSFTVKIVLSRKAIILEPGDFFKVNCPEANLDNQILRVMSTKIMEDLTVEVDAYFLDPESMAWNVADTRDYTIRKLRSFEVEPPFNVYYRAIADESNVNNKISGELYWEYETESTAIEFIIDAKKQGVDKWSTLGRSRGNTFVLPPIEDGVYSFRVAATSINGRKSEWVAASLPSGSSQLIDVKAPVYNTVVPVYRNPVTGAITYNPTSQLDQVAYVTGSGTSVPLGNPAGENLSWNDSVSIPLGATLPEMGRRDGDIFIKFPENTLYRWDANTLTWKADVTATPSVGSIDVSRFQPGLEPVTVITGSIPTVKTTSSIVRNNILYRWNGTSYVNVQKAADLEGQIISDQIANLQAAKLVGEINVSSIPAESITADKFGPGLQPVTVVNSLPTTKTVDVISYQNTLYQWDTSTNSYKKSLNEVSAIPASQLTGTLATNQISNSAVTADKIAANAITAAKIEANAITADKIAANAVTSAKIEAGSIVADKIGANAVTADKINASAITTDKIAANAVTSAKIVAGAIDVTKLAANSVTADKIAAGSIDATKITANAITADKIQAGSILASKLVLNDTSNMIPDATYADPASWIGTGSIVAAGGWAGWGYYRLSEGSNVATFGRSLVMPVESSRDYFVSIRCRRSVSTGATYTVKVEWFTDIAAATAVSEEDIVTAGVSGGWALITKQVRAPATAKAVKLVYVRDAGNTAGNVQFAEPVMRRAADAELIVNGTITGAKIAANTITASQLATTELITNSAQIGNGLITNAKIGGDIQSTVFTAGDSGVGWKIQRDGYAEFNNVTIRRYNEVASGSISFGQFNIDQNTETGGGADIYPTDNNNNVWARKANRTLWVNETGVPIDRWGDSRYAHVVTCNMVGEVIGHSAFYPDIWWGWTGELLPLTKRDTNVHPTITHSLRIRFDLWSRNLSGMHAGTLYWKVLRVG